jgi:hypothetical protein
MQKILKKTWDILREATTGSNKQEKIEKISIDNEFLTDPEKISEEYNKFFKSVGVAISQTVEPKTTDPEEYCNYRINTELNLGTFSQADFINIVEGFQPKESKDYYGINNKLLQFLRFEIATPLTHIFNLSFRTGKFPSNLKLVELCQSLKQVTALAVITTVLFLYYAQSQKS